MEAKSSPNIPNKDIQMSSDQPESTKVDSITKLLEKCFALQSFEDDHTKSSEDNETEKTEEILDIKPDIEDIEDSKSELTDTESECKMWQYATNEIENYESQKGMNFIPIIL